MTFHFNQAEYLTSATKLAQLPEDTGAEVAFIGRSNAGKSSALNAIANKKSLARVSKTPGRTQMINLFSLTDTQRLVDLPGYGFAQVPMAMKAEWEVTINDYLAKRTCLKGLVMLMDIRHPMKPLDQTLIQWTLDAHIPLLILLTKADKLKSGAQQKTLQEVKKQLPDEVKVQTFSSPAKTGLEEARATLTGWLS